MIELFQFQRDASATIAGRFVEYLDDPVIVGTAKKSRRVPFYQTLSALTASGKTVILADATAAVAAAMPVAPIVLWLSKGTVVVEQSLANLMPGGKYHHLLGDFGVKALGDYDEIEVEESTRPLIFFGTVGTFNQRDKEKGDRLIYRSEIDTASQSTWDALKARQDLNKDRRPLVVVYDEAHNLSEQQTNLLLELEPDGFLLASATMRIPARLANEVDALKANGKTDDWLTTRVRPKDVADSGLVKTTVSLGGYKAPMEETVSELLADMDQTEGDAAKYGLSGSPKAIYVTNTNMVATDSARRDDPKRPFLQREAPPILIWRYLTEGHGVDAAKIATYASLKFDKDFPKPDDFVLFSGGDKDYANFIAGDYQHVIFNLSLQEGWDDPLAYFAYIDRSMESKIQIEQVIGRLLRQPEAHHFPAERLNTAHFYVRVDKNATFNAVVDDVNRRLAQEAPGIKILKTAPGKPRPTEYQPKEDVRVPATAYDARETITPIDTLINNLSDYRNDKVNTRGEGGRRLVQQKVGGAAEVSEWETFQQSNLVSARWIFHREVKRQFARALEVASTAHPKFDALVGLGSPAYAHIVDVAHKVVDSYVKNVMLVQRKVDPYRVGPVLAREDDLITFSNSLHPGYDGLNTPEQAFARALDRSSIPWCRNLPRSGYGIPLITPGATTTFFPDFLAWRPDGLVLALDTKGEHILLEAAGRKLLNIRTPPGAPSTLAIHFVSEGRFNEQVQRKDKEGYTVWSRREDGTLRASHLAELDDVVASLMET